MTKYALLILLNLLIVSLKAQVSRDLSLEANTSIGNIIRHSKRLVIPPTKNTISAEIHANWQLKGQKEWHEWHGFPSIGASLMYIDLGEPETVGAAVGLCPTIDFKILKIGPLSIKSQIGTGIGYLTRHYDQFDNPTYNAVGSHLNCMLHLKLSAETRLTPQIKAHLAGSFTHFSNGGARLPNFGINIPAVEMGVRWMLDTEGVFIRHHLPATSTKKWGINTVAGMALSSNNTRGPKYPIYNASVALVRHFSKKNRLHLGVCYEQNRLIAEFGLHAPFYQTRQEARLASERWTGFLEDEILFGRVAMVFQSGVYFRKFEGVRNLWYNKLGLRVYLPPIGYPKTQFHLGFYLKAHLATAEYIAFTGGASF
jgi:Lipid A 3-O-deacylase (PagL)